VRRRVMATTRETFFECSFTSAHDHRTAHVRAWTASEAARIFQAVLEQDGVDEAGTIEVSGAGKGKIEVTGARAARAAAH